MRDTCPRPTSTLRERRSKSGSTSSASWPIYLVNSSTYPPAKAARRFATGYARSANSSTSTTARFTESDPTVCCSTLSAGSETAFRRCWYPWGRRIASNGRSNASGPARWCPARRSLTFQTRPTAPHFRRPEYKSTVAVPLSVAGRVVGAVGFSSVHAERTWPPEVIHRFTLIASVLRPGPGAAACGTRRWRRRRRKRSA